jgi:hypothetical protein
MTGRNCEFTAKICEMTGRNCGITDRQAEVKPVPQKTYRTNTIITDKHSNIVKINLKA